MSFELWVAGAVVNIDASLLVLACTKLDRVTDHILTIAPLNNITKNGSKDDNVRIAHKSGDPRCACKATIDQFMDVRSWLHR